MVSVAGEFSVALISVGSSSIVRFDTLVGTYRSTIVGRGRFRELHKRKREGKMRSGWHWLAMYPSSPGVTNIMLPACILPIRANSTRSGHN